MITKQLFGRTGHESTRAVFGGAALSKVTQDEADQTLEVLLRSQIAATHLRSLERFDFDSVLLPYSHIIMQDPHYASAFERVVSVCAERNVAVLTIKSIARRPWWGREQWTQNGEKAPTRTKSDQWRWG